MRRGLMRIGAIAHNTFREGLRSKVAYSLLALAAGALGVALLFGSVTIGGELSVVKDFGLFSLSLFGTLLAVTSGVNLLNKEIQRKTIYNILSKPVARWQFIIGKFLGLCLTIFPLNTLLILGVVALCFSLEGRLDLMLLVPYLFSLLEVTVIAAVVIFFSSFITTPTLVGILAFATYLAGHSIQYLQHFFADHRALLSTLDFLLPDLSLFNVSQRILAGRCIAVTELLSALLYTTGYTVTLLIVSCLLFSRRELR